MGIADEIQRLAELHASGAMSDQEFAQAKARLLSDDEEDEAAPPRTIQTALPKTLAGELAGALTTAVIIAAIAALLGYVLLLEHTARFVAPVVCRGEYSAGFEVEEVVTYDAGRRLSDVYMSCLSEDGSRKSVGGLAIYGSLLVEFTLVFFVLYVIVFSRSVFRRKS